MANKDQRGGYRSGGKCPKCGGLVEIRSTLKPGEVIYYAQCGKCPWNTLR